MFGYLRPREGDLLVKEQELYRAVYCGLCRCMRKKIGFLASLSLNYDFVFLALLRAEVTGETLQFCQKRCPVHPLKKRNCTTLNSPALEFTAKVHFALTYEKVCDDLRDPDTRWAKKLLFCFYRFLLRGRVRRLNQKDEEFSKIKEFASSACNKLYRLEQECDRTEQNGGLIDELCHTCAEGIANACAIGLEERARRLMFSAASVCGQLIYLLDACDDLQEDARCGSFNAYIRAYGSADDARAHLDDIAVTLALYAGELDAAVSLICPPNRYGGICENVTKKGIPDAIFRIVNKNKSEPTSERKTI